MCIRDRTYATRFVSPSFGFALGWNYWFNWAITVAAELSAAGIVMQYWLPDSPGWVWSVIFLTILVVLNLLSARAYGEGEFWFAIVKVIAVIVFLIVGVLMIAGIMGGSSPGTSNWTAGDAPFVNGFGGSDDRLPRCGILLPGNRAHWCCRWGVKGPP